MEENPLQKNAHANAYNKMLPFIARNLFKHAIGL
jgi:hypothetical protein